MRSLAILFLLFFTIPFTNVAQQQLFTTYAMNDGLVHNTVREIYQDSTGFIWIGTWEGLSKYDGHKFTNYTTVNGLSNGMINDMYESPEGKLFVAENNGDVDILQRDAIAKRSAFNGASINKFYTTRDHRVF